MGVELLMTAALAAPMAPAGMPDDSAGTPTGIAALHASIWRSPEGWVLEMAYRVQCDFAAGGPAREPYELTFELTWLGRVLTDVTGEPLRFTVPVTEDDRRRIPDAPASVVQATLAVDTLRVARDLAVTAALWRAGADEPLATAAAPVVLTAAPVTQRPTLPPAYPVDAAAPRYRRIDPDADLDIDDLDGYVRRGADDWRLTVEYDIEVEDLEPVCPLELVVNVTEFGRVIANRDGQALEFVIPMGVPTEVDDDEYTFEGAAEMSLPTGSFRSPRNLRIHARLVSPGFPAVFDADSASVSYVYSKR